MEVKIALTPLRATTGKPPGYYEDFVSNGRVENGTLVIDRDVCIALAKKYSQKLPPVTTQAKNLMAAGKALLNPKSVSKDERNRRLAICNSCEFLIDGKRCSKCGCFVSWKTRLETWHCPINKW